MGGDEPSGSSLLEGRGQYDVYQFHALVMNAKTSIGNVVKTDAEPPVIGEAIIQFRT